MLSNKYIYLIQKLYNSENIYKVHNFDDFLESNNSVILLKIMYSNLQSDPLSDPLNDPLNKINNLFDINYSPKIINNIKYYTGDYINMIKDICNLINNNEANDEYYKGTKKYIKIKINNENVLSNMPIYNIKYLKDNNIKNDDYYINNLFINKLINEKLININDRYDINDNNFVKNINKYKQHIDIENFDIKNYKLSQKHLINTKDKINILFSDTIINNTLIVQSIISKSQQGNNDYSILNNEDINQMYSSIWNNFENRYFKLLTDIDSSYSILSHLYESKIAEEILEQECRNIYNSEYFSTDAKATKVTEKCKCDISNNLHTIYSTDLSMEKDYLHNNDSNDSNYSKILSTEKNKYLNIIKLNNKYYEYNHLRTYLAYIIKFNNDGEYFLLNCNYFPIGFDYYDELYMQNDFTNREYLFNNDTYPWKSKSNYNKYIKTFKDIINKIKLKINKNKFTPLFLDELV